MEEKCNVFFEIRNSGKLVSNDAFNTVLEI